MKKSIIVKLEEKELEVKKLPIIRYAEMLKAIKELPQHLGKLDLQKLDVEELIKQLPYLVGVALPDVIGILTIATDLEKEEVEQLGLDEITDVVVAVAEVNNYRNVFDKVKKALAQPELMEAIQQKTQTS